MAKYSKKNQISSQTQEESLKIAMGIQRPGQSKEQTKLIAQGIQKGIDQYKKTQKVKSREADKQRKKQNKARQNDEAQIDYSDHSHSTRSSLIPWGLLVLSWMGFIAYFSLD